jgi:hypothetical protein
LQEFWQLEFHENIVLDTVFPHVSIFYDTDEIVDDETEFSLVLHFFQILIENQVDLFLIQCFAVQNDQGNPDQQIHYLHLKLVFFHIENLENQTF